MTRNPVQRSASKHIDLADHYAREQQERGTVNISYVSTKDMRADALTKHLAYCDFQRHTERDDSHRRAVIELRLDQLCSRGRVSKLLL